MNGDLSLLFIGGVIGILGSIVGYFLNHLLKLREQKILREFEIREKGRDFFHQIYGYVAILSDLATSVLWEEEDTGESMVLIENGYTVLPIDEIIRRYKTTYEKYAKLWYESREKGLEVFLPREFAKLLASFWAYAGFFYQHEEWNENQTLLKNFRKISKNISDSLINS